MATAVLPSANPLARSCELGLASLFAPSVAAPLVRRGLATSVGDYGLEALFGALAAPAPALPAFAPATVMAAPVPAPTLAPAPAPLALPEFGLHLMFPDGIDELVALPAPPEPVIPCPVNPCPPAAPVVPKYHVCTVCGEDNFPANRHIRRLGPCNTVVCASCYHEWLQVEVKSGATHFTCFNRGCHHEVDTTSELALIVSLGCGAYARSE
jgi:hypothetical protein